MKDKYYYCDENLKNVPIISEQFLNLEKKKKNLKIPYKFEE